MFEYTQEQLNFIENWVKEVLGFEGDYNVVTSNSQMMVPFVLIEIEDEEGKHRINTGLTLERMQDEMR